MQATIYSLKFFSLLWVTKHKHSERHFPPHIFWFWYWSSILGVLFSFFCVILVLTLNGLVSRDTFVRYQLTFPPPVADSESFRSHNEQPRWLLVQQRPLQRSWSSQSAWTRHCRTSLSRPPLRQPTLRTMNWRVDLKKKTLSSVTPGPNDSQKIRFLNSGFV